MSGIEAIQGAVSEGLAEFQQAASLAATAEQHEETAAAALEQAAEYIAQAMGSLAVYRQSIQDTAAAIGQARNHVDTGYRTVMSALQGSRHEDEVKNVLIDFGSEFITAGSATNERVAKAGDADAPLAAAKAKVEGMQHRMSNRTSVKQAAGSYEPVRASLEQFISNL